MSILHAMKIESLLESAIAYRANGVNVIPLRGKKPSLQSWLHWQTNLVTPEIICNWHNVNLLTNIGIVCGSVSGGLVVLDLDGWEAIHLFEATFPEWTNTLCVRTGSGIGKHYYYFSEEVPPTTRAKGFELRSDGAYVVGPPSKHPDTGSLYTIERDSQALVVKSVSPLEDWIRAMSKNALAINHDDQHKATTYAAAALKWECEKVAHATQGNANNVLYIASLKLAKYIANQAISRGEVENALLQSARALSNRDTEIASYRTIQSGLNTGLRNAGV